MFQLDITFVKLEVSQEDTSPLKTRAPKNMLLIFVMLEVSQLDTTPLKILAWHSIVFVIDSVSYFCNGLCFFTFCNRHIISHDDTVLCHYVTHSVIISQCNMTSWHTWHCMMLNSIYSNHFILSYNTWFHCILLHHSLWRFIAQFHLFHCMIVWWSMNLLCLRCVASCVTLKHSIVLDWLFLRCVASYAILKHSIMSDWLSPWYITCHTM